MTKAKTTKRALLTSVLSMMLCMAMLVGSTFAWFTDSVTSGKNRIVAGNLDVELYYNNASTNDWADASAASVAEPNFFVDKDGNDILWEPGVMAYTYFKVTNEGSLALKYKLTTTVEGCNTLDGRDLSEVIKFAVLEGQKDLSKGRDSEVLANLTYANFDAFKPTGNLGPKPEDGESSDVFTVVAYWKPNAEDDDQFNVKNGATVSDYDENKDNNHLWLDIGVRLDATQDTVEIDSFDNQYDKNAWVELVAKPNGDGTYSDGEKTYVKVNNDYVEVTADETTEGLYKDADGNNYVLTAGALKQAAATGDKVVVLSPLTYSPGNDVQLINSTSANVDFGGNKLTIESKNGKNGVFNSGSGKKISLSNGTIEANKTTGTSNALVCATLGGVVNLTNLTLKVTEGTGTVVSCSESGSNVVITNCDITAPVPGNTATYAVFVGSSGSVTIEGSTVSGLVKTMVSSTVTVKDTTFTGDVQSQGKTILENCTVTGNVRQSSGLGLTIKDSTINGNISVSGPTVIKSGTITGSLTVENGTLSIESGTFGFDPTKYTRNQVINNGDGTWTVGIVG